MSKETQNASEGQEVETKDQKELKTEDKAETKSEETTEAPAVDEVDWEAKLKERDERIAKLTTDRDNYRKGMLKNKGKLPTEEEQEVDELSTEEKMRKIAKEEFLNTEIAKELEAKKEDLAILAKENKELRVAVKNSNKSNLSPDGIGSDSSKNEEKDTFSPQKIAQLRARARQLGIDEDYYIKTARKNVGKSDAEKGITINKETGI